MIPAAFSNGWMNWGSPPYPPQEANDQMAPSGPVEMHSVHAEAFEGGGMLGKAEEIRGADA